MGKPHERSNYLINPKFQWNIIRKFLALTFFNILSFYWIVHYFFFNLESKAKMIGLVKDHPFYLFLNEQKTLMILLFLIVSVLNISIIMVTGIFISQKIAGLMFRLKKFFNEEDIKIAGRISFREDDYFLDLEDAVNNFVFRNEKTDEAEESKVNPDGNDKKVIK